VESKVGSGTTFIVWLPATAAEPVAAPADETRVTAATTVAAAEVAQHAGAGETVLVIDDDPDARQLMQRFLGKAGFRVLAAPSGEVGLELAREHRPAAITLDVMMPSMDGWAVLSQLKAAPELADIPVIMLTMVEDKDLGYALGASDYLSKPVDRDRLLSALSRFATGPQPGRVLVVEDDTDIREMVRRSLTKAGWEVDEAENGRLALERLESRQPDVILLDLMMPEMDGFEFVERMRANDDWRSIPVLVLTAKDMTDEDRARLNGGVERVIQKGDYSREKLLAEVQRVVRGRSAPTREPDAGAG
ncbi:MAG: response regulator, partial [Phycisphaerae bacterium]|nr:response regulator [Phycisphaerae bacterium]